MTFLGGRAWIVFGVMDKLGVCLDSLSPLRDRRMAYIDRLDQHLDIHFAISACSAHARTCKNRGALA